MSFRYALEELTEEELLEIDREIADPQRLDDDATAATATASS